MNEFYNKMKYFEETEKIPAQIYYHYTTLDALYSIVTSKTFRLTSLKSSNDKSELFYKPERFLTDFQEIIDIENNENEKNYFKLVKKSIGQNKDKFLQECRARRYPYALCLSEKKDNLTHWDRYASGCTGVCIGFNVAALNVYLQRMASLTFGIGLYDVGKVLYSDAEREKYIRNGLIRFFNLLYEQEGTRLEKKELLELIEKNGYVYATSIYLQLAKFVKKDSFIDEDEVRLYHDTASIKSTLHLIDLMESSIESELYNNLRKNFKDVTKNLCLDKEQFGMMKSGIRGYKALCLEEIWGSGTIPEIILGPMCVQNCNELRRFLKANGLEGTKVSTSKVPIR